jgi:hypothetical protein
VVLGGARLQHGMHVDVGAAAKLRASTDYGPRPVYGPRPNSGPRPREIILYTYS